MADRSVWIANRAKVTMRAHTRHAPRANSGKRRQFPPGAAGRMLCSAPTEIPIGGVGPTRRTTSGRHCWGPELIVRLGTGATTHLSPDAVRSHPCGADRPPPRPCPECASRSCDPVGRRDTRVPKQDTGAPSPTHGGSARCFTGYLLGPAVDSGGSVYDLSGLLRSAST